ncbi:MAG: OadG family protein [Paludibacteraceae bacterium]|nr:OadG family protein [Paludibacteraceae bacterium]
MTLLVITSQTWLVTFLGFGIVLVLLCTFVFLMQGLGAIMQWLDRKSAPAAAPVAPKRSDVTAKGEPSDNDMAAIAMALHLNESDADMAAVAMALHLYNNEKLSAIPQITLQGHSSAWNNKTFGLNNINR